MAGIEELLVTIASKFDDAGFKALDRSTSKANKATSVLSNSLRGLFVGIIGTIGAREIVNATVKLDSLTTSMNALAGSQEAGAAQMKFLRQETNRLGQDFMTTAEAYKNLFSSGKGAGMADSDIQSIFSGVLEAGTVLGSSQQQLQGALTALEQMISKGKVSTQELRLQLGNALPGAMQIAARAMNVTNQEFQAMLESGLDSQKFVMAFANQLHTEFSGKATEASHTLRAELARLQNSIFDLETSLLDGDAGKEFANVIRQITSLLQSDQVKQSLNAVAQILTVILQHSKEIALIVGVIFGNKMLAGLAKGLVGAGAGIANGLKMAMNLKSLTAGMSFLPRIWEIIKLVFWALNPLSKITSIITIILSAITAIAAFCLWFKNKDKKEKDKKAQEEKPNWQPTSDGRYTDVNPKSKTYMQFGQKYTEDDIANWLANGYRREISPTFEKYPNAQFGGMRQNPNPISRNVNQQNSITISKLEINTKEDDTNGIVVGIRNELTKIIDNFGKAQGYGRSVYSDRY